jgi:hypothetical protein
MMIGMQKMLRETIEIVHAVVSLMMNLLLRRVQQLRCSLWRSQREGVLLWSAAKAKDVCS